MQYLHQLIPTQSSLRRIHLQYHVLIVVPLVLVQRDQLDTRDALESLSITGIVAQVCADDLIQALQAGQPHRSGDLAHLAVDANVDDIVVAGKAKVLH